MNYWKKNKKNLELYNIFTTISIENIENIHDWQSQVITTEEGCFLNIDKGMYQICSRRPKAESKIIRRNLEKTRDYLLVLFGMGNIELIRDLVNETSEESRIMIIEPNLWVARYMFEKEDFFDILKSKKVAFGIGNMEQVEFVINNYMSLKWENLVLNLRVLMLPNYYRYSSFCLECIQLIHKILALNIKSLGNDLEDTLIGAKHHAINLEACLKSSSLEGMQGNFKNVPAIIVCAGPSLDKNIHLLKEAKGKALIIACDASYSQCIEQGVIPDGIASIERVEATYKLFYKDKIFPQSLVLMGPSLMWPDMYKTIPGKMILTSKDPDGLEKWWADFFPNIEFLPQGHSCSTVAYALAHRIGCSPIIMIGQDLAYTDNKFHSDAVRSNVFNLDNAVTSKNSGGDYFVEDINGNKVRTSFVFNLFREFFEINILDTGQLLVDATEGGAKIKGSKIMSFREAIDRYCTTELTYNLSECLVKPIVTNQDIILKGNEIIIKIKEIIGFINEIKSRAISHYNNLIAYKEFDFSHASEQELYNIVVKMQEGNNLVQYITKEQDDILSYYQHIIKAAIVKVKGIGNELTAWTVCQNWMIQVNLMHMFEITSIKTEETFLEMIAEIRKIIEEKERLDDEEIISGN